MKKIFFVTASMSRGGAERVVSILSDYFIKAGYDVSILVLFKGDLVYALNEKVKFIDSSVQGSKIIKFAKSVFNSRRIIKKEKPDIVFSFLDSISIILGFSCIGLHTKLVCCERIDPSATKRSLIFRRLINIIYSRCSKTTVQTKRAFDYFPEKVRKNSVIIPNPVSVTCYAVDYSKRKKRFVSAGRLTAQKNQKMMIDAFADVHKKHSDWIMDIYGEGELRPDLEKQIINLNLENAVFLKGDSSDVHRDMNDASCFVFSSDYEGFSNAMLEAMMMGLCTITTNVAGSDEAIQNGENGLIVPVNNRDALRDAMLNVIENIDLREKMGDRACFTAKSYEKENVTKMWQALVDELER